MTQRELKTLYAFKNLYDAYQQLPITQRTAIAPVLDEQLKRAQLAIRQYKGKAMPIVHFDFDNGIVKTGTLSLRKFYDIFNFIKPKSNGTHSHTKRSKSGSQCFNNAGKLS